MNEIGRKFATLNQSFYCKFQWCAYTIATHRLIVTYVNKT